MEDYYCGDIFDWILETEKELNIAYDSSAKYYDGLVREDHERKRLKQQTEHFSHDDVKIYISKHLRRLFGFRLIGIEQQLINGRIDILAKDCYENIVGIEIKKKALHTEYFQFNNYYTELKELYGSNFKLIILSSSFQNKLLELDCSKFELWRYEIWWDRIKLKNNNIKYKLQEIKVCTYDEENNFVDLFKEEKIHYLRRYKK
jgi:hypothetical protein